MMVAVAVFRPSAVVFPPQQSPTFGQRASSQTVCKFKPRRSFLILLKEAPEGIEVFRKEGNRGLGDVVRNIEIYKSTCTHPFVLPRTTRSGDSSEMKSWKLGPLSRDLPKSVRGGGDVVANDVVARQRL